MTPVCLTSAIPARHQNVLMRWIAMFADFVNYAADADSVYRSRYSEAVNCYGMLIDRLCFGYSKTSADFDDLKQDVLMNLWVSMPKFNGECSMKTWVYRLTLNVCVSSLRKSYRRVSTVQLTELYDIIDCEPEYKDLFADLHKAIASLNHLDKAIMMLWLEDESYDDISEITGLTRANVATRIHRAKNKIKSKIEK